MNVYEKVDLKIESLVQDWDALDEKLLDGEEHVTKKGWRFINNFGVCSDKERP